MAFVLETLLWITYFLSLYFTIFWFIVFIEKWEVMKEEKPKKLISFPMVSIVIPAYNEQDSIIETIQSTIDLEYPKEKLEIIVVNDGSTDLTRERVEKFIKKHNNIFLINQTNKGKAAALNNALEKSKGEIFICLDADSTVMSSSLIKMLPHFEDKKVAAVVPLMKAKEPKNLLQTLQFREYLVNVFLKKLMGYLDCIHVTPGPFSTYRKSVIKKLGGFEVGNITEDLEMAMRLQSHNYRIIQDMHAEVYTKTPSDLKTYFKQRSRWNKGGIINGLKYRKMIFNKEYGDFGLIQTPILIGSGILALIIMYGILFYLIEPNWNNIINLMNINFDVLTLLRNMKLNINILDLNFPRTVVFLVMVFFTSFTLYHSHKHTRESLRGKGVFSLIVYLFLYFLLLGVVWISLLKDFIIRKEQVW